MKVSEINPFIKKNYRKLSDRKLAAKCGITKTAVEHRRQRMGLLRDPIVVPKTYVEKQEAKATKQNQEKEIKSLTEKVATLEKTHKTILALSKTPSTHVIKKSVRTGGEATLVALLSDVHIEEEVRPSHVNEINSYSLPIAKARLDHYFTTLLRLVKIEQTHTKVETLVLALLGDFITGNIHDDAVLALQENEALVFAQEHLISGIDYLLANSKLKLVIPCHSGNHARVTKEQRHATEHQFSVEWLMYKFLAAHYKGNSRVTFIIPEGYHSYLQIYDKTVRFHHGHNIRYGGGIGGITIPVNKAINEWNKLRFAHMDCFGHFHQAVDGGNFIANGSMIGFNAYALSIKASPEEPAQMLFGVHSKLGFYLTRRIKFPHWSEHKL